MYRHVLCVYPYRIGSGRTDYWPPLGLETIAAVLEPHAKAIDIIDLRWERGRTADFLRADTDLVCFSVNWGREPDFVLQEIRSVPERFLTIVGGRHASQDPEKWLSDCPNVDILVRGDGEETIEEILRGRPLDQIAGISYPLNGRVVHNPTRQCGPVRDDLYPRRHLRRYAYQVSLNYYPMGLTFDAIGSSRGCPFNCTFCSFNRNPWGTKRNWSARSPESVVRELEEIDARYVAFVDDNFTHDMDRVGAICDLIVARGIRKRYAVNTRVDVARRPDVLRKMERAGFAMLGLGVESTQDRTLRSMKKGFNTKRLREYFRVLRRSRIFLHGYFIIGNIGETEEEMLETASFARELGVDSIALSSLRNERYSGLEELVAASPGYHIADNSLVYSDDLPLDHLRRIRRTIARDFYRPGQILRILEKAIRNRFLTPRLLAGLLRYYARKIVLRRVPAEGGCPALALKGL